VRTIELKVLNEKITNSKKREQNVAVTLEVGGGGTRPGRGEGKL
jgi:hypothetical protein